MVGGGDGGTQGAHFIDHCTVVPGWWFDEEGTVVARKWVAAIFLCVHIRSDRWSSAHPGRTEPTINRRTSHPANSLSHHPARWVPTSDAALNTLIYIETMHPPGLSPEMSELPLIAFTDVLSPCLLSPWDAPPELCRERIAHGMAWHGMAGLGNNVSFRIGAELVVKHWVTSRSKSDTIRSSRAFWQQRRWTTHAQETIATLVFPRWVPIRDRQFSDESA